MLDDALLYGVSKKSLILALGNSIGLDLATELFSNHP